MFLYNNLFNHGKRLPGQANIFRGQLTAADGGPMEGFAQVIFPLSKDSIQIESSEIIKINLTEKNHHLFYVSDGFVKSKIFRYNSKMAPDTVYRVPMHDVPYYTNYQKKKICPICLNSEGLLEIIYGFPTRKMWQLAKEGKIALGGCVPSEDEPIYFCKKYQFRF